jgi:predicted nucleotide-binding protein
VARIDPELFSRLQHKLGLAPAALYKRIQSTANKYMLERPEAALALAADLNLNISKYATREQRQQIASARQGRAPGTNTTRAAAVVPIVQGASRSSRSKKPKVKKTIRNSVFVVVGRNGKINKALFQFLRALDLIPIEWERARAKTGKANPYIGEILEEGFKMATAVVVLMTPDDEAKLKDEFHKDVEDSFEKVPTGQARPNVLFEAGYAMGKYPENTVLVQVGKLRPFSDISG